MNEDKAITEIGQRWYVKMEFKATQTLEGKSYVLKSHCKKVIVEIVGKSNDGYSLVSYHHPISGRYGLTSVKDEYLISRYEPNWFWKLLGYK